MTDPTHAPSSAARAEIAAEAAAHTQRARDSGTLTSYCIAVDAFVELRFFDRFAGKTVSAPEFRAVFEGIIDIAQAGIAALDAASDRPAGEEEQP